jgi:hypothetical protein
MFQLLNKTNVNIELVYFKIFVVLMASVLQNYESFRKGLLVSGLMLEIWNSRIQIRNVSVRNFKLYVYIYYVRLSENGRKRCDITTRQQFVTFDLEAEEGRHKGHTELLHLLIHN